MIQPKDLRIGNVVDLYGTQATIQGEDFKNHFSDDSRKFDRFKPIPLTEEWLIRLGFEKKQSNSLEYFYTNTYPYFSIIQDIKSSRFVAKLRFSLAVELKTVHELQNLYYALTNTELEIKETINQ